MESKNITILVVCVAALSAILSTLAMSVVSAKFAANKDAQPIAELQLRIEKLENLLDLQKTDREKLSAQINQGDTPNIEQNNQFSEEISDDEETDEAESDSQQLAQESPSDFQQFRQERLPRTLSEARKRRLVSAGFAEEEASWLLKNESDVQLQTLYSDHEARRTALQNDQNQARTSSAADQLRAKIGDEYYERYLKANNRSTSVSVGSILESSPGEIAGLQTGDRIVRYAGERVFNVRDLNNLTVQGTVGESILLEVERNGTPVQLTIPRGPVGINTSRR